MKKSKIKTQFSDTSAIIEFLKTVIAVDIVRQTDEMIVLGGEITKLFSGSERLFQLVIITKIENSLIIEIIVAAGRNHYDIDWGSENRLLKKLKSQFIRFCESKEIQILH